MDVSSIQTLVLTVSVGLIAGQLLVKQKTTTHILFAVFCASVSMSLVQSMSGANVGAYQYLIGMGACFTCNGYWLLSRSLFRTKQAFTYHHLALAGVIGFLIMMNQGYLFASNTMVGVAEGGQAFRDVSREITVLLSSCILVLSFWEGCRGFTSASSTEKAQRLLFLATFGGAVAISKVANVLLATEPDSQQMVTTLIILYVLVNTQVLLWWRSAKGNNELAQSVSGIMEEATQHVTESDRQLAQQAEHLIVDDALYLQPNLKIADVARKLDVSEYKVSKALRHHLNAKNFNQYVNEFRIKHAQRLLAESDSQKWPVLVVGLESGFASVGPFTRAFKSYAGCTPNQFRQRQSQLVSNG